MTNEVANVAPSMKASHQWATRPDDQRFISLIEMHEFNNNIRERSAQRVLLSNKLEVRPVESDSKALVVAGPGGRHATMTNWSFRQLAELAECPPAFLLKLANVGGVPLAADNLNFGLNCLRQREDIGVLYTKHDRAELSELRAVTGPNYGRVWNAQLTEALINRFGDGVSGDFRVPGEFGKAVDVNRRNTTLYASDRDMFVFLADEKNRIEIPNRRNGQSGSLARGFYVWNSEVGKTSFGLAMFLFDFVCMNRIVWGMEGYEEIRLAHTQTAPDRWLEEVHPAILAYSQASEQPIKAAIEAARGAKIMDADKFLKERRFSGTMAKALQTVHAAEEGRPIETLWDAATAITAYARNVQHQDVRVDLEKQAGAIMRLAA